MSRHFASAFLSSAVLLRATWATVPRSEIVDLVRQTSVLAEAHDRQGWLKLFTADATVEDPVGTGAQVGSVNIGHFYDAFIAPNEVNFTKVLERDIVSNYSKCEKTDCHAVVGRYVQVTTKLSTGPIAHSGLVVKVDPILFYEVVGTPEGLRIQSLRSYWPLSSELGQVRRSRLALPTLVALGQNLLKNLGLAGTLNYFKGTAGVGDAGDQVMHDLIGAMSNSNKTKFMEILGKAQCNMPSAKPVSCDAAWKLLGSDQYHVGKVHSAGMFTAAALHRIVSGHTLAFRLSFNGAKQVTKFEVVLDDADLPASLASDMPQPARHVQEPSSAPIVV